MFTQQLTTAATNRAADAILAPLNGTMLRIYDGNQPNDSDDLITTQRLLVECQFNMQAFQPASRGKAVANAFAPGKAINDGQASWFRTDAFDGSVGPWREGKEQAANLELRETYIEEGRMVQIDTLTYVQKRE